MSLPAAWPSRNHCCQWPCGATRFPSSPGTDACKCFVWTITVCNPGCKRGKNTWGWSWAGCRRTKRGPGHCCLVAEQSNDRFNWWQNDVGIWTEAPAFPIWIFLTTCWSSDSCRDAVTCVKAVVPQQRHRESETEKRKAFDIPISNGSVCAESEEAQKNSGKEREGFLDLSSYHNWLVKEHLKLFVCRVLTKTTFPFLILRQKVAPWNHWTYLQLFLVSTGPPSHTNSTIAVLLV